MSERTAIYSDFLQNAQDLIGADTLLSTEKTALNSYFRTWIRKGWTRARWPDICRLESRNPEGRVHSISVDNPGSSYETAPTVAIVSGDTGATATASVNSAGQVSSIKVTAGGTGYQSAPAVTFSGGGGSGATATASLSYTIDYTQSGENEIGEFFNIFTSDPYYNTYPGEIPFVLDQNGALLPDVTTYGTAFVYYRQRIPDYSAYDGTSSAQTFPYKFFSYVVYGAYSDWLQAEGQHQKSGVAQKQAEETILQELDILERQQRQQMRTSFTNHNTEQGR